MSDRYSGFSVDAQLHAGTLVEAVTAELARYTDVSRVATVSRDTDVPGLADLRITPPLTAEGGYGMAAFLRGYDAAMSIER